MGGFAALCAVTALFAGGAPTWLLRLLAVLAALAAVFGALLLRAWDSDAGRRVAKERAATAAVSWRLDEHQAELEEARELVTSLEEKVRAKRAELGRLRGEHADLLRRYARAEDDRARALEGRRRLALEAARPVPALEESGRDAGEGPDTGSRPGGAGEPSPELYRRALAALDSLARRTASPAAERATPAAGTDTPGGGSGSARERGRAGSRPKGFDFFGPGAAPRPRRMPGAPAAGSAASAGPTGDPGPTSDTTAGDAVATGSGSVRTDRGSEEGEPAGEAGERKAEATETAAEDGKTTAEAGAAEAGDVPEPDPARSPGPAAA
ncbi:hypothetical protein GCM10027160_25390 [Streptomyces calidiresistens]